jgi:hypothetical protein
MPSNEAVPSSLENDGSSAHIVINDPDFEKDTISTTSEGYESLPETALTESLFPLNITSIVKVLPTLYDPEDGLSVRLAAKRFCIPDTMNSERIATRKLRAKIFVF